MNMILHFLTLVITYKLLETWNASLPIFSGIYGAVCVVSYHYFYVVHNYQLKSVKEEEKS